MNWFLVLMVITVIVRGMGAGIIYDVAVLGLDTRKEIGVVAYARYARALFSGRGARTFVPIAIGGLLLTLIAAVSALVWNTSSGVRWWTCTALVTTVFAFAGTSQALPAVTKVRHVDDDEPELSALLDQFARWHTFSTFWQVISFIALVVALACYSVK